MQLTDRDRQRLRGVHPDLIRVVERAAAISDIDFAVLEGTRSVARQRELVAKGASKTMNSRHIPAQNGFGHAVDLAPLVDLNADGKISSAEMFHWPLYHRLSPIIKAAARAEGVPIEWGGDWKNFKDGPHWQLPWKRYSGQGADPAVAAEPPATEARSDRIATSRTIQGASVAAAGGGAIVAEAATELAGAAQQADGYFSAGDVLGFVVGGLILVGALYALFARWDDAGRPVPWRRKTSWSD